MPTWKNNITPTASAYSPMINAPIVAMDIKKFSSNSLPFIPFLIAAHTMRHPSITKVTTINGIIYCSDTQLVNSATTITIAPIIIPTKLELCSWSSSACCAFLDARTNGTTTTPSSVASHTAWICSCKASISSTVEVIRNCFVPIVKVAADTDSS